jgi:hypothetical protein
MTLFSSAKGKRPHFADIAEFREFVIAAIKRWPGVNNVVASSGDPAKFEIKMDKWSSTGDVTNIFGHLNAYPDEDANNVIERFIRSITEAGPAVVSDENIVAVIRNREYTSQEGALISSTSRSGPTLLLHTWPIGRTRCRRSRRRTWQARICRVCAG